MVVYMINELSIKNSSELCCGGNSAPLPFNVTIVHSYCENCETGESVEAPQFVEGQS